MAKKKVKKQKVKSAQEYKLNKKRDRLKVSVYSNQEEFEELEGLEAAKKQSKKFSKRPKLPKSTNLAYGRVLSYTCGYYTVDGPSGLELCHLRGIHKKALKASHQPVVVGDRVFYSKIEEATAADKEATGIIEKIEPRVNRFARLASHRKTRIEQVLAANIDQVLLVASLSCPKTPLALIDRYILAANQDKLDLLLILNKYDLNSDNIKQYFAYRGLVKDIILTSAITGLGLPALKASITGKSSLLAGSSGAGKSSILNRINPDFHLAVGKISAATLKGKHTTTKTSMLKLFKDTYLIDSPGIREFGLIEYTKEDVEKVFPKIASYAKFCRFRDCDHLNTVDCEVKKAVKEAKILPGRYKSYLKLIAEIPQDNPIY